MPSSNTSLPEGRAGGALVRPAAAAVLANARQHTSCLQAAARGQAPPREEACPVRAAVAPSPESPDPGPTDPSQLWIPELVDRIASSLSPNEAVCLRLVSRDLARALRHRTVLSLSQPVPPEVFAAHWSRPGACKGLTLAQRRQLITLTARSNVVANLEVAVAAAGLAPRQEDLEAAAGAGALESCCWLVGSGGLPQLQEKQWESMLSAAARGGHKRVCSWCLESCPSLLRTFHRIGRVPGESALLAAAQGGHAGLAEELGAGAVKVPGAERGTLGRLWLSLTIEANKGCDLGAVKRLCSKVPWAPQRWPAQDMRSALVVAVLSPTPDWHAKAEHWAGLGAALPPAEGQRALSSVLSLTAENWQARAEFLLARGAVVSPQCYPGAAGAPVGAVEQRFDWLKAHGVGPGPHLSELIGTVTAAGDTAALAWLLAEAAAGGQVGPQLLSLLGAAKQAAKAGHLEVLQLLTAAKCVTLGARAMPALANAAASGGQLAVLQWAAAASSDALSSPVPFAAAASTGSVEMLRWLLQRGCSMQAGAWAAAARSGCEAAVELLAELGCPKPEDGSPYHSCMEVGDWRLLSVLRRAEVPLGSPQLLFQKAVASGAPLAALQGLAPWSSLGLHWKAVEKAVVAGLADWPNDSDKVLAWVREQRTQAAGTQRQGQAAQRKRGPRAGSR